MHDCMHTYLHAHTDTETDTDTDTHTDTDTDTDTAEAVFVDVTVRYPLAARYLRGAEGCSSSNSFGFACRVANEEKHKRYPSSNGIRCSPFALETFGRISDESFDFLDSLAAAASARDVARALPPRPRKRLWLQKLSVTLQRALSLNVLDGLGQHVNSI